MSEHIKFKNDITGQRFGKLVAIEPFDKVGKRTRWKCICDCGNTAVVYLFSLTGGKTKSCGCTSRYKNLSGLDFGKLKAIEPTGEKLYGCSVWKCQCSCGNYVNVPINKLTSGKTIDCGCVKIEKKQAKDDERQKRLEKYNLAGRSFGKLKVLEKVVTEKGPLWKCQCSCGKTTVTSYTGLTSGRTKSCGCLLATDIKGQTFGKLTAIKRTDKQYYGTYMWECLCECGNITYVSVNSLKTGSVKSCGCLKNLDLKGKRIGRLTVIEKTGEKKYNSSVWKCQCSCGNIVEYTTAMLTSKTTKITSCGCLKKEMLTKDTPNSHFKDGTHITRIKSTKLAKNNTSGFTGVRQLKNGKWLATITFQKNLMLNATFDDFESAVKARLEAEDKYFKPIIDKYFNIENHA